MKRLDKNEMIKSLENEHENIHELKTWPEYFQAVISDKKKFEIRENDRDFKVNDELILKEYDPVIGEYTGREAQCIVTYTLDK